MGTAAPVRPDDESNLRSVIVTNSKLKKKALKTPKTRAFPDTPAAVPRSVVSLTGREGEGHRRASIRGNQMNLGAPSAAGLADRPLSRQDRLDAAVWLPGDLHIARRCQLS